MKRVLILLLAFCIITPLRADVGPPEGKKIIPVTTIVEVPEHFPDYAFFETSYSARPGPPPHGGSSHSVTLHFFVPNTTIKDTGARRSGSTLYAVPRHVAEDMFGWKGHAADAAKQDPPKHWRVSTSDDRWFKLARSINAGEVPGAVSIPFGTSKEVDITDSRTAITVHYRIVRTPAGVTFARPGEESAASNEDGDSGRSSAIPWKWIAAGGAASLALILAGVWFAWRFTRRA